jgi:tRNA (cytidine/uridine-2'-O-)-methyltransferase
MPHIALYEPEIPPNTGNILRLCAATGATLHLIGRLGFRLDDRHLKRAALDYLPGVRLAAYPTFADFEASLGESRLICLSAHVSRRYTDIRYRENDFLLFGSESRGLPESILARHAELAATVPMPAGGVRNLNLATAAGIVLYEALRQIHGW